MRSINFQSSIVPVSVSFKQIVEIQGVLSIPILESKVVFLLTSISWLHASKNACNGAWLGKHAAKVANVSAKTSPKMHV